MKYRVLKDSFDLNGERYVKGTLVEIKDENDAARFLQRGDIEQLRVLVVTPESIQATPPESERVEVDVLDDVQPEIVKPKGRGRPKKGAK